MNTNPYAPPQAPAEADPVEELCVRAPDLRDEIQAVAATGNQGPLSPKKGSKVTTVIFYLFMLLVALFFSFYKRR